MKNTQTKIEKLSPEQLKAIAPLHAAAAVVAPKAEKTALNDDKNRKKLTPEQTEEELKALDQAQADQVAEVAGEPIELAAAEVVATDAASGALVTEPITSGLVGGAAVAGGAGAGAAAGGALLGVAALNNGGDDAQPRMLTQFSSENKGAAFNQQNVIADVVEIEAASVSVGTIAADASTTTVSEAQTNGGSQTTTGVAEAAVSVDIAAENDIMIGNVWRAIPSEFSTDPELFELNASPVYVGPVENSVVGIQAQQVELVSTSGDIFASDIGGGGSFVQTSSQSFQAGDEDTPDTQTTRFEFNSKLDAADSVSITALNGNVSVGDGWRSEGSMPGIHASVVTITADSVGQLNIDGGSETSTVDSETRFIFKSELSKLDSLPFRDEETFTVFAADSVTINLLEMDEELSETVGSVFGADIQSKVTAVNAASIEFANFGGGSKYEFVDSFDPEAAEDKQYTYVDTFTQSASDSVTFNVLGGVVGVDVSAKNFISTADFYDYVSVDGGFTENYNTEFFAADAAVFVAENEAFVPQAAAFVDIEATSTTGPSYLDVLALKGFIDTVGASGSTGSTGDYVTVRNAEDQLQEIKINLGQGGNDSLDFEGYNSADIVKATSGVVGDELKIVFTDGVASDTYMVLNVENFSFNDTLMTYNQLLSFINNANMPEVG